MRKTTYLLPVLVVAIVIVLSSIFVVDEREKALVLQFGQIKAVKEEPGLAFKIPLIQEVVRYDDRILSLDTETIEVTPADDRRLVVDAFARYRIADVVQFRQAVGIGGERVAEDRLSGILNAQIREVLGADQVTSDRILSEERGALMIRIRDSARAEARSLGLDVVDVRLKQTNLPAQNLDATFDRMRAEREREAADERARGNEAAQRVRALADRTVVETLSEAEREANVIRGEADAERNAIFAQAYGADPEFFAFYRSLQAYQTALPGANSSMVMTPDSQFFDYFKSENAESGFSAAATRQPVTGEAPEFTDPEAIEDETPETPAPVDPEPAQESEPEQEPETEPEPEQEPETGSETAPASDAPAPEEQAPETEDAPASN